MDQENKKQYEAPHLTVVEFKTEQGFAASGAGMSNYSNNSSESWFDGLTGGGSGSGVSDYSNNSSDSWF